MRKILLLILAAISLDISAQTVEWVNTFGGTGDDEGHKCAVDTDGNLLFTGTFSDEIDFGNTSINSEGRRDFFVLKTDKSGNTIWAKCGGGDKTSSTIGRAVATDANNNVYIGGVYYDTLNIGTEQFIAINDATSTNPDCFIAKYSATGELQWVKTFFGEGGDVIEEMNIHNNQLIIAGSYKLSFDVLGNSITSDDPEVLSNYNPFVASLTLEGDLNWFSKVNCKSGTCRGFDIDKDGDVNILLEAKGSLAVKSLLTGDQYPLKQSNAAQDNYIAKLNSNDGSLVWGNRLGSASFVMGYAVDTDNEGNIYCGGLFQSELKLESLDGKYQKVNATDKFDYYVCKYSSEGNLQWVDAQGGTSTEGILDLIVDEEGNLYAAGYFINPETIIHDQQFTCTDGNEALLIKYNKSGQFQWAKQTQTTNNSGYIYSMEMVSKDSLVVLGHFKGDGTFFDGETYSTPDTKKDIWYGLIYDEETEPTDISDVLKSNTHIKIYPVPANQYLSVKSLDPSDPIESISIYNVIGNLVYLSEENDGELSLRQIPSGVYIIKVDTKFNKITKQIYIQH